jgi:hypothetical protein
MHNLRLFKNWEFLVFGNLASNEDNADKQSNTAFWMLSPCSENDNQDYVSGKDHIHELWEKKAGWYWMTNTLTCNLQIMAVYVLQLLWWQIMSDELTMYM